MHVLNRTARGGLDPRPGLSSLLVYFCAGLVAFTLFDGLGVTELQAADLPQAISSSSIVQVDPLFAESDDAPGGIVELFLEYQRAIWIIAGLVMVITLMLIYMARHRRIERRLLESEGRWKLLFKNLPGCSFIVNEQREIEDVNDALCDMTGFSREELIGKSCEMVCTSPMEKCLPSSCGLRRITQSEGFIKARDGRVVPVLKSVQRMPLEGRTVILENLQDMTRHKKMENSLHRSEESERIFRKRLTSLHEMNMILTHADSRDDLCRQAVELGRDRLEFKRIEIWFTSERPAEIVGSYGIDENGRLRDDRRNRRAIGEKHFMRKALDTNRPGLFFETDDTCGSPSRKIGEEPRAASTLWDGRNIIGFILADTRHASKGTCEVQQKILNIFAFTLGHMCARLAMGEERSNFEAQLQQSAKMEAVGRLAGGVAHDFNNQLTVITGYCDLLMRDIEPGSLVHESIEQIDKSARQATILTGELLNLSRKETIKPDVVDPKRMICGMEKSLSMLGEDIKLEINTAASIGNVKVDANRFQQVIMNLAINARDAMPDGGRLLIEAKNCVVQPQSPTIVGLKPGPYVRITVTDSGVGMDKGTREKVFEPFFTTKDKGKGTGLGLSQVYGFVQQSGGGIEIESQLGRGTTFKIYLPHIEEPVTDMAGTYAKTPAKKGNETVLVVEDDPAVRRLVVRVLREYGYNVLETGHPEDALRMVRQAEKPIDLLISDVVMPGLSGPKMAEELDAIQPGMKVLYVSGYTEETVIKHGVQDLSISFLHKPFSPEELYEAIQQVLAADNKDPIVVL